MAYLTVVQFRLESVMPDASIDELEAVAPGWLANRLERRSGWMDALLRKRYAAPFADPVPDAVVDWLQKIVSFEAYQKLGTNPSDQQIATVQAAHDNAIKDLREAADSEKGLFDLPLRKDTGSTGVTKGGPLGYSEASPYVWMDVQAAAGRDEDANGRGTS